MRRDPDIRSGYCGFCDEQKYMCFSFDDAEDCGRDCICFECLTEARAMIEEQTKEES